MKATTRATVKTASVIANPRNNRMHPPEQLDMLIASIRRFGQPRPLLVRKANRMLVAGHGIHQAMTLLQMPEIDVILWDVDQATADEFLMADNRLGEHSHFDRERTQALLEGVPNDAYAALGFTEADIDAIFKDEIEAALTVREIDTSTISDRFWITVQGPLEQQALALQRLQQVMADVPDVEVELGTVQGC